MAYKTSGRSRAAADGADETESGERGVFSRRSMPGRIAQELAKRILSGSLKPGAALPGTGGFEAEFNASRTVMRETIKLLAAKGLVESRPRTGTRVRPARHWNAVDPDILTWRLEIGDRERFAHELFQLRRIIEPAAAALAAANATEDDANALKAAYGDMERALAADPADAAASVEPDFRFHHTILAASGNQLLGGLAMVIETALKASFAINATLPDAPRLRLADHKAVMQAILARAPTEARAAMEVLLANAESDLHRVIGRRARSR